jgi:F420-non-reducing hydrogenase large subunit
VGLEIGGKVIQCRKYGHTVVEMIGGRKVHPCTSIPGGLSKGITQEQRDEIEPMARWAVDFALFSLQLFKDVVLKNQGYLDLILSQAFTLPTYYMGMVDAKDKTNFYDGKVRVVDPEGKEFCKFTPREYSKVIAERVEPWSYLKFPYLVQVGWKGFVDGKQSGVYRATPQARLNVADSMGTPLAQAAYEEYFETLTADRSGKTPVHHTLAIHWARVVELVYAAERALELVRHPELTHPEHYRTIPSDTPTEGVGIVEAPRGTLVHHYLTDENGIVRKANLVVGTTNNHAAICMSIKQAAQGLIKHGTIVSEGLLNMVEMAFRAYDPCFGCATHSLPGAMPLVVRLRDATGEVVSELRRL